MPNYVKLPTFDDDGNLNMVVETPRGSAVKLKYEPKAKVFIVSRSLVLGLIYPFDWGFIPGTKSEDGDPLDGWRYTILRLTPGWCCRAAP